jgi:hypothetical protein
MKIQLLSFAECPNGPTTRERLQHVIRELGVEAPIEEIDVTAPTTPVELRGWSSPTILIDGEDLEGAVAGDCPSCRLYSGGGAPSETLIRRAVRAKLRSRNSTGLWASLPAIGASLLSAVTCPACLGPWASILGALGLGFVMFTQVFAVVFLAALVFGTSSVAYATRRHGSPWPLMLTVVGAIAAAGGRFLLAEPAIERLGFPLLLAGALLGFWLTRKHAEART